MTIGICGTGRMGTAMAERLMEMGEEIAVWNRSPERAEPLIDQGARFYATPADLAAVSNVIISIVLDDDAATAVSEGDGGLATTNLCDTLVIEMSTMGAQTVWRIAAAICEAGGRFVECPVGGTVPPARQGQLLGLAAGDPEVVDEARPVLDKLCRRVEHVGAFGTGAAMKLAINLPLLVYFAAVGEALCITEQAGIDRNLAADLLADSSGAAKVAGLFLPHIAKAIDGDLGQARLMEVTGGAKDLELALETASGLAAHFPVTRAVYDRYVAAIAEGAKDMECGLLPAWLVRRAGFPS